MRSFQSNRTALLLCILVLICMLASISFGAADINFRTSVQALLQALKVADYNLPHWLVTVVTMVRLPRILLAAVTGAGLAAAGTVFQAVFQNPLAEPYLLGVSSGASLGSTIAIVFGAGMFVGSLGSITVFSFAGSLLSIVVVILIGGRSRGNFSNLLLGGIAVGYICQAAVSFLMMLNRDKTDKIVFWTMGSFSAANWNKVIISALIVAVSLIIIAVNAEKLNIMSLGSEEAHSLGVNPGRTGVFLLVISCLMTAAVVSVSGIIGFVGLIVPHMMRVFTGADNRRLLPASAAGGALLMLISDIAARTVIAPKEIPIGVITAFIGGPFLLAILRKRRAGLP